jgi:hypothetical protein
MKQADIDAIKESLLKIPGVTRVEVETRIEVTAYTTLELRRADRRPIYSEEMRIAQQFPEESFNFHVIDECDDPES